MLQRLILVALVSSGLLACECNKAADPKPPPAAVTLTGAGPALGPEVRAKVNGVAITGAEVGARLAGTAMGPNGERATAEQQQAALEQVIQEELQAQRALALGYPVEATDGGVLDARALEARRHNLAKQFRMKELLEKSAPTPEETRAWFDANTARVQAELQVQYLVVAGKQTGDAVLAQLAAGKSFDEVAAALFPKAPDPKPWAVQPMSWAQVPPPWWPQLDQLQPGKTSGLIADQGDRYWIVKLVERKQNPAITYEEVAPAISASLQAANFETRRETVMKELRSAAKIELISR